MLARLPLLAGLALLPSLPLLTGLDLLPLLALLGRLPPLLASLALLALLAGLSLLPLLTSLALLAILCRLLVLLSGLGHALLAFLEFRERLLVRCIRRKLLIRRGCALRSMAEALFCRACVTFRERIRGGL